MRADSPTDDQILAAVRDGARIHHVSDRLGLGGKARPALRRRLKRLEAAGKVARSERHSFFNSIYWVPRP